MTEDKNHIFKGYGVEICGTRENNTSIYNKEIKLLTKIKDIYCIRGLLESLPDGMELEIWMSEYGEKDALIGRYRGTATNISTSVQYDKKYDDGNYGDTYVRFIINASNDEESNRIYAANENIRLRPGKGNIKIVIR